MILDENDYLLAVLCAIQLVSKSKHEWLDFGKPRRHDWGHIITDVIRANLGNIAFMRYAGSTSFIPEKLFYLHSGLSCKHLKNEVSAIGNAILDRLTSKEQGRLTS